MISPEEIKVDINDKLGAKNLSSDSEGEESESESSLISDDISIKRKANKLKKKIIKSSNKKSTKKKANK